MTDKELEEQIKQELYELALCEDSDRDDKYHKDHELVKIIPVDLIEFYN